MKKLAILFITALLLAVSISPLVQTVFAAGNNLILNPSAETASGTAPANWKSYKTGTNNTTFSYLTTGRTGSRSLKTQMTSRSSGQAGWEFTTVVVSPSTKYTYTDWYQSNVASSLAVVVTATNGSTSTPTTSSLAASTTWKQSSLTFTTPSNASKVTIHHYINRVGQLTTDDYDLEGPAAVAPTVNVTAPANGATVQNTQSLTANATGAVGVQFKVDNTNVGTEDTAAPYTASWNTTTLANGNHTVTALARSSTGLTTTSSPVTVNVQNTVVTPPVTPPTGSNLIPNPSFETANGSTPASWLSSNWGTNTSTFSYLNTGHTGNRSAKVETTAFTNGAANWYYADIPATAGKTYKYENWYQSNVDTEVDAEIVMNDGSVQYAWLGTVFASTSWAKFSTTYTVPAGAKSIAIYQILAKKGYIVSDDYSLSVYTPAPLTRGLVSVTFDDGWANQYANALNTLQQLGIKSTFYIISSELNDTPDYMTSTQVKDLYTKGHEIGSHSVTHSDMTTLSQTNLVNEFAQSKTTLQNLIGVPVTDFAYPYGAYNANTINTGKTYYTSQRSVNGGLNTKDSFDITQLKIQEVDSNISQAQVQGWINAAVSQHAWLILVYHEVANAPVTPDDALYTTKPADFTAEMAYLKNSGVTTVTVNQAINEILAQL